MSIDRIDNCRRHVERRKFAMKNDLPGIGVVVANGSRALNFRPAPRIQSGPVVC